MDWGWGRSVSVGTPDRRNRQILFRTRVEIKRDEKSTALSPKVPDGIRAGYAAPSRIGVQQRSTKRTRFPIESPEMAETSIAVLDVPSTGSDVGELEGCSARYRNGGTLARSLACGNRPVMSRAEYEDKRALSPRIRHA